MVLRSTTGIVRECCVFIVGCHTINFLPTGATKTQFYIKVISYLYVGYGGSNISCTMCSPTVGVSCGSMLLIYIEWGNFVMD